MAPDAKLRTLGQILAQTENSCSSGGNCRLDYFPENAGVYAISRHRDRCCLYRSGKASLADNPRHLGLGRLVMDGCVMAGEMIFVALSLTLLPATSGWVSVKAARWFSHQNPRSLAPLLFAADFLVALWTYRAVPPDLFWITYSLGCALALLACIDILVFRLPDLLTWPLALTGLTQALLFPAPSLLDRLAGFGLGYGVLAVLALLYRHWRGREGMGLGDAKLTAAAGAWLGWQALPSFLLIASLGGLIWAVFRASKGTFSTTDPLPFGVPLTLTFWVIWLYGTPNFG